MNLSEREWMVLRALWETGGAELGTLVQRLQPETGWSRNTVLTYLTRMEGKGLVAIDKTLRRINTARCRIRKAAESRNERASWSGSTAARRGT